MDPEPETITLKNGKSVPAAIAVTTMINLKDLYYGYKFDIDSQMAVIAMVRFLRFAEPVAPRYLTILVERALMQENGQFMSFVGDILESATVGTALINLVISSPVLNTR